MGVSSQLVGSKAQLSNNMYYLNTHSPTLGDTSINNFAIFAANNGFNVQSSSHLTMEQAYKNLNNYNIYNNSSSPTFDNMIISGAGPPSLNTLPTGTPEVYPMP